MTVPEVLRRLPWRRSRSRRGPGANERIAVWLTAKVGSMPAAYLFCLLAMISLPAAIASKDLLVIVAWVAQTFIQLVLLPVIMVGQDVAGRRTEATIADTHRLAVAEHEQTREVLTDLADAHRDTHELLTAVHGIVPDLKAVLSAVGAVGAVLADTPESGDGTAKA